MRELFRPHRAVGGRRSGETVAETVAAGVETKRPDPPKWYRTFELPLLGSNQDSPDPEGPLYPPQIPATCRHLREIVSPDAGV
jgi:hypothetical protein